MTFVRVRLPNGFEATLAEGYAQNEGLEVLDTPATDLRGRPLPASRKNGRPVMPRTSVKKAAAKKAAVASKSTTGGDAEGGTP